MEFYSLFRSFLGYGKGKCGVQDVFGNITDFDNKWISRNLIHLHMKLDIILFVFIDIPMITMLMHLACQPLKNLDIRITGSLDHCINNTDLHNLTIFQYGSYILIIHHKHRSHGLQIAIGVDIFYKRALALMCFHQIDRHQLLDSFSYGDPADSHCLC